MKAVITAGGLAGGTFSAAAGTPVKALAPVRGIPMLESVIVALREAGADRIALIAGPEVRERYAARVEQTIDASPSGGANIMRALNAWTEDGGPLLYATCDLPYITGAAIADFVARTPDGALAMSLVKSERYASRFPECPSFGITLAGERIVNGGVFLLPPGGAARIERIATPLFDARKRPWRMASLIGIGTLWRWVTGTLSVGNLEAKASSVLGMPSAAVRDCAPELAFDVDTVADYRYACEHV
jgi:GTP:adenosylcobinamide-phosphate guanylyltransferase